jgi:hypothetical protein
MLAPSYLQGFSGDPMQLRWKRGFLRLWAMLALLWVASCGWREYSANGWTDPGIHVGGEWRDQWRDSIRQKLKVCEYAEPLVQRWTAWANVNYVALENSLILVLLPPFLLLFFGFCVGWIVSGFKPKAS